jgi:lipopolysaccharide export LptBFGC system permease protein LptF
LVDGSEHETDPKDPDRYQISTFEQTDIPIELPSAENKPEESQPAGEMDTQTLHQRAIGSDPVSARWYSIELHRRFALPSACLVMALVGIPLGLSSKKSGKSGGFVLTILLVFAYYVVSLIGVSFARQGKVVPWFGAWLADLVFLGLGVFLLQRTKKRPLELASLRVWRPKVPARSTASAAAAMRTLSNVLTRRRLQRQLLPA